MKLERNLLVNQAWLDDYIAKLSMVPESKITEIFGTKIETPDVLHELTRKQAVININGPMSIDGPSPIDILLGERGTSYVEIQEAFIAADQELDDDGEIIANINSPGGNVDGVDETWMVIRDVASRRKVTFINQGQMTSAAAWIASAGTEILASSGTSMFGSIGVVINALDISEFLKSKGIVQRTITNKEASEKRPSISTEEGRGVIQGTLDEIYSVFKSRIIEGLKISEQQIDDLKGGVRLTEEAIKIGLADGQTFKNKTESAPQTREELNAMNLTEFLAENPSAKAELDVIKNDAYKAGADSEKEKIKSRVERAKPFLSNASYPAKVSEFAAGVVLGEKSIDALEALTIVLDATSEKEKSEEAKSLTEEIETPVLETKKSESKTKASDDETNRNRARLGLPPLEVK